MRILGAGGCRPVGTTNARFIGHQTSGAGDIDHDGHDDLILGWVEIDTLDRVAYVLYGSPDIGAGGAISLDSIDGNNGFLLYTDSAGDSLGRTTIDAGDLNGDGIDDVAIGAPTLRGADDTLTTGGTYILFGRARDSDDDNTPDAEDNCTFTANADQRDTDSDGFGNLCDADLNNDLEVNFADFSIFKSVFFSQDADADFNGDGQVDFSDLAIMKSLIFHGPGPAGI